MLTTSVISSLSFLVVGIVVVAGIFAIIREIVLWYFRINEFMEVAKETRDYLRMLAHAATSQPNAATPQANPYPAQPTLSGWRSNGKPKPKDTSPIWRDNS